MREELVSDSKPIRLQFTVEPNPISDKLRARLPKIQDKIVLGAESIVVKSKRIMCMSSSDLK